MRVSRYLDIIFYIECAGSDFEILYLGIIEGIRGAVYLAPNTPNQSLWSRDPIVANLKR